LRRQLARIYREHHPFVWRSLARLGVPSSSVADAVHDVFVVAGRRLDEFEGRSSMRTWLFAIAIRVAKSCRRDASREQQRKRSWFRLSSRTEQPHARTDAACTLDALLDHLDDTKRAVFIMAELEGMTAPEIASALGIKPATVYSRLRLARAELQRVMIRQRARERRST
jgi:RNA polymerase sigma-70 factor (ECF subfamily)